MHPPVDINRTYISYQRKWVSYRICTMLGRKEVYLLLAWNRKFVFVFHILFPFQSCSLKQLGQLKLNLVGMYIGLSSSMLNAIFNNISVTSWRSVLLVEETGVPGVNHWTAASHWQTLLHNNSYMIYIIRNPILWLGISTYGGGVFVSLFFDRRCSPDYFFRNVNKMVAWIPDNKKR